MDRFARAAAVAIALASAVPAAADGLASAAPAAAGPASAADVGAEVVLRALSLLGVNYRFGGNTPETGLDCSGLVRLVFHETVGLPLPRRSEEISRVGGAVHRSDLRPGDLVFFNTLRRAFSHVGIYIGDGRFVHAPSTGGSIRVERLGSSYWARRFDGARRIVDADPIGTTIAAAQAGDARGTVATGARPAPARTTVAARAPTRSGRNAGPAALPDASFANLYLN